MANELEQRAKELLAKEYREQIDDMHAEAILRGDYDGGPALRAIAAALQQAQQPGAQAVASSKPWDIDALIAAVHEYEEMRAHGDADDIDDALMGVMLAMPDDTAPPPLPEGVSHDDIAAALDAFEAEFKNGSLWSATKAALESYRARLAAKGGV